MIGLYILFLGIVFVTILHIRTVGKYVGLIVGLYLVSRAARKERERYGR